MPALEELYLAENRLYMLGTSMELIQLLPALNTLDLSFNSLYDRVELLCLKEHSIMYELDLQGNSCANKEKFDAELMQDYPQLGILNGKRLARAGALEREIEELKEQIELERIYQLTERGTESPVKSQTRFFTARPSTGRPGTSRPGTAKPAQPQIKKILAQDENLFMRKLEELEVEVLEKRNYLKNIVAKIRQECEKAYEIPGGPLITPAPSSPVKQPYIPSVIAEEPEHDSMDDLEKREQEWFQEQLEGLRAATASNALRSIIDSAKEERLKALRTSNRSDSSRPMKHRYIKHNRPVVPFVPKEVATDVRKTVNSRARQRLENARSIERLNKK